MKYLLPVLLLAGGIYYWTLRTPENAAPRGQALMQLHVDGTFCEGCATAINDRLKSVAGISETDMDHLSGDLKIRHDGTLTFSAVQHALAGSGYTPQEPLP